MNGPTGAWPGMDHRPGPVERQMLGEWHDPEGDWDGPLFMNRRAVRSKRCARQTTKTTTTKETTK